MGTFAKSPMEVPHSHSNYQTFTMVKTNGKEFLPSLPIYRYFGSFPKFTIIYLFWIPNYFIQSGFLLSTLYSFGKLAFYMFFEFFKSTLGYVYDVIYFSLFQSWS